MYIFPPSVLVACEIQTASSRIWTWIAMFLFYDNNNYNMNASMYN